MRSYAQIVCRIWEDPDFIALSPGAQRTYLMLLSQPDIAACGSLPLTLKRWGMSIAPSYRKQLEGWLRELEDGRFIIIDRTTEEVLIRTFVKWDHGYGNVKRRKAIETSSRTIRSQPIRDALASELRKLDIAPAFPVSAGGKGIEGASEAYPGPIEGASSSDPNQSVPGSTYVTTDVPGTGNREPGTGNRDSAPQAASPPPLAADTFPAFWAAYPRKDDKPKALAAYRKAVKVAHPEAIIAGAQRYAADENRKPQFTKLPATWLHAEAWGNGPLPPDDDGRRKPTPDEKIAQTMTIGRQMDARNGHRAAAHTYPLELTS